MPSQPCTRLFLSVDIVGSTAYKQHSTSSLVADQSSLDVRWPTLFLRFFQDFPSIFASCLDEAQSATNVADFKPAPPPVLWKAIGDELVFYQEVSTEAQVGVAV